MTLREEFDALWRAAEARQAAGDPPLRHVALAYQMPAGDSEISARAWMTEEEADRVYALAFVIAAQDRQAAGDRIQAKIAARAA